MTKLEARGWQNGSGNRQMSVQMKPTRIFLTWRAFSHPWKIRLQALVDEIDQIFVVIRHIAQRHGLLKGHMNLDVSQRNLTNSQKILAMQARSFARLKKLESMMEQVRATLIRFSKERDVHQTDNLLRRCPQEILQDPAKRGSSIVTGAEEERQGGPETYNEDINFSR